MQSAIESLDIESAETIIEQISSNDASLAKTLGDLVYEFRFDILQELFEEIK